MDAPDTRPVCSLPDGPITIGILAGLPDCRIEVPPEGFTIDVPMEMHDKHGHKLDGDHDPKGHDGCDHRDTKEWKAEHPRGKERKATPMAESIQKPVEPPHAETAEQPAAPAVTETIGVEAAVSQVKSLVPADTSPALMIGGAAVLAVVGGALKFGPSLLKARAEKAERDHEAKMKELELREKESEKSDDQHGNCAAERSALSAKVAGIEAKVGAIESKVDAVGRKVEKAVSSVPQFDEDFDPEAIRKRLTKLEKAVKTAPKKR